ncbi:hypothetical protein LTR36_003149 [Oleoguttula mirabilis]|uniref:Uncharacterized protein n=1 Tax=Oleoguttula mirabilis TaxID=1507867 RepID=A0AAV9JX97_9PEZI|nr:hypothetical protein LTR36_003149 [Oleoguttula mirabilis]
MDNSPFARLPAEIRNHVYALVLKRDTPYVLTSARNLRNLVLEGNSEQKHPLGLSATCKALNAEFTPFFYAENRFIIKCPVRQELLTLFRKFKDVIGARNATALRSFTVDAGRILCHEWELCYREDIKKLIVGCYLDDVQQTPECEVMNKVHFVYGEAPYTPERCGVAMGLRVGCCNGSWSRIIENLDATMRTHKEVTVTTAAGAVKLLLLELRKALPIDMRS